MIVIAVAGTSTESILRSRSRNLAQTERELQTTAIVLAAQTQRTFESVRLAQASINEALESTGCGFVDPLVRCARTRSIYEILRDKTSALDGLDAFLIISNEGELLNSSRAWPTPVVVAPHRDYITAFQADPHLADYVSRPLRSHLTGAWTIFMAHQLVGAGGRSIGFVVATFRLSAFEDLYQSLGLPDDASVNLFRADGTMLARYPHVDPVIGKSALDGGGLFSAVANKNRSAVVIGKSFIDGRMKLFAAQKLTRPQVVITVARGVDAVSSAWRRDSLQLALTTLATAVIAAVAAVLSVKQIRRANRAARCDNLTRAGNRVLFHEDIEVALRDRSPFALLIADLDNFKDVNDRFGHQAGDALLIAAFRRLKTLLEPRDTLARMGGDEFAIIRRGPLTRAETEALAARILDAFVPPFSVCGTHITIGISLGVTFSDPESQGDGLYRRADLALYRAKFAGRGVFFVFEESMAELITSKRERTQELKAALSSGEMHLAYQPILNLREDRVTAVEALVRWRHPRHGEMLPSEFIALAEESGEIGSLGRWVLQEACAAATAWPQNVRLAVNLSTAQFAVSDVYADVQSALEQSRLEPGRLELEITESVKITADERAMATLLRIKQLGVRLSLDDFGTGYSSLSYLRSLPFDKIKIDRSFIGNLPGSSCSATIVETILLMARKLGMETTAEGVETAEQLQYLRKLGCTEIQGYLVSRPVPAYELTIALQFSSSSVQRLVPSLSDHGLYARSRCHVPGPVDELV